MQFELLGATGVGDDVPGVEAAMGVPAVTFVTPAQDLVQEGEGSAAHVVVGAGHHEAHGSHPGCLDGTAVPAGERHQFGDGLRVLTLAESNV